MNKKKYLLNRIIIACYQFKKNPLTPGCKLEIRGNYG